MNIAAIRIAFSAFALLSLRAPVAAADGLHTVVVMSVDKCFAALGEKQALYIETHYADRYTECTRRLKLKVNAAKSAVARPGERKFLGFSIGGREARRRIAPKALRRFKLRVRELTGRSRGISVDRMVKELTRYLRGWRSYFGFCETPSVLERLDRWIRRRLRSVIWKQRKRRSSWHLANSPALSTTFPNAYFDSLGLPRLFVG